eukprot:GAFH01002767.1.p3 GENE.GAFH01002767.1~~GAFH01002767.1.p3  ORF type:complete len:164 (-),score=26.29 GAFH01002767.1:111-602(-)
MLAQVQGHDRCLQFWADRSVHLPSSAGGGWVGRRALTQRIGGPGEPQHGGSHRGDADPLAHPLGGPGPGNGRRGGGRLLGPPSAPPAAVSKRTLKQPHAESVDPDRAARLKALEAEADERGDEGIAFAPEPAPHHRAKAAGGDARLVTKNEKLPLLSGRSGLR